MKMPLLFLLALWLYSAQSVLIGVYIANSSEVGTDKCDYLESYITAFSNVCTASLNVGGIKLTTCSDNLVKASIWRGSSSVPPTCSGTPSGNPKTINATKDCSLWYIYSTSGYAYYTKILDSTCVAPNLANILIASSVADYNEISICPSNYDKEFFTVIADGNCNIVSNGISLNVNYKASVSSSGEVSVSTYYPLGTNCQDSALDNRWPSMIANGKCSRVIIGNGKQNDYLNSSLALSKPVVDDFSGLIALAAAIVITISVLGVCICCCAVWGILHCIGIISCPCFNSICNRRPKAISSSTPSYPIPIPSSTTHSGSQISQNQAQQHAYASQQSRQIQHVPHQYAPQQQVPTAVPLQQPQQFPSQQYSAQSQYVPQQQFSSQYGNRF
jgi:hypothetical protein